MIDAEALRDTIQTLLTGQLGTYAFSTGDTTPAIRIEDGAEPYSEEPQVTGLEVVIRPETTIGVTPMLAGDRRVDYRSEIVLKQFDITLTTRTAREILIAKLEGLEEIGAVVPRSTRLDTIETITLIVGDGFHLLG